MINSIESSGRRFFNPGNDSNLLIVFYVQIVPDDFVMQLHRFGERQGLPAQPCQMLSQIQVVSLNSLRVTLTDDVQFSFRRDSYIGQPSVIHTTTSKLTAGSEDAPVWP